MRKFIAVLCLIVLAQVAASTADAKVSDETKQQFLSKFTPAVPHWALENGHEAPSPDKLRGYVVMMKGGVPTGRAYWFMTMAEYEYRPVDVVNDELKTYRGKPYVHLMPGQVMLISDVSFSNRMIYLKLLSPNILVPGDRKEKHPSRASVMIGFKLPEEAMDNANMDEIYKTVEQWVRPFQDSSSASQFAMKTFGIGGSDVRVGTTPKPQSKSTVSNTSRPVDLAVGDPHAGRDEKTVAKSAQPTTPTVNSSTRPVDLAIGDSFSDRTQKSVTKAAQPNIDQWSDLDVAKPAKNTVASKKQPATISDGSSFEEVINTYGQPKSRIDLKDKTLLDYKDRTMVFRNGKLVDVNLK